MPQYFTLLSALSDVVIKIDWAKAAITAVRHASPQIKAIVTVIVLGVVTLGLGSAAILTSYVYVSLLPLGMIYGVVLSYPMISFFGPRVQPMVAGLMGGITLGNVGTQQAKLRALIIGLGDWIKQQVTLIHPAGSAAAAQLNTAIVWSVWMAILICLAILAANAFYANKDGNRVGQQIQPPKAAAQTNKG